MFQQKAEIKKLKNRKPSPDRDLKGKREKPVPGIPPNYKLDMNINSVYDPKQRDSKLRVKSSAR